MKFKVVHLPCFESKWVPCKLNEAQPKNLYSKKLFPKILETRVPK